DCRVTSEAGGVAPLQRRTKMSLTIMTEIMIRSTVVMTLRNRERAPSGGAGRLSGTALRHARHEPCLRRPRCPCFRQGRAGLGNHPPGAVEHALAQLQSEQPVAVEGARQRQLAGLRGREAEAGG